MGQVIYMKAVVLSGGGSKGSYQIGVWKALRKLKFKYDIVTGTSVGALNGALMVQNKYHKACGLWKNINMNTLFGNEVSIPNNKQELMKLYRSNFFKNGGMKINELQNLIDKTIDNDLFFKSKINYGLITINVSNKKFLQLEKNKIRKNKLCDYLIASASCYPAFQAKDIDGKKYIDGGMFDNLPINLAVKLGANEIIAVDLCAPGIKQIVKNKKNLKLTIIKPNNKLSSFLNFNEEESKINMKYGYNDTMKVFDKYYGKKYTFKKRGFKKINDDYKQVFIKKIKDILKIKRVISLDINKINDKLMLKIIEDIGKLFNVDDYKIYSFKRYNKLLLKRTKKIIKGNKPINKKMSNVINLYKMCLCDDYKNMSFKNIISSKELLMAIYLYTVSEI